MKVQLTLLGSISLIAFAAPALGQSAQAPSAAPGPASQTVGEAPPAAGEIIVTANKRAQNINNVGLTITALSGATLENRRITSLADLAATVPGLTFSQSSTNTPILTLRGVGYNDNALGVYSAVSVYVDEVPLPFPVMSSHAAFDLSRVEVLKGPQGILFGENATGGAINYIAAKPTSVFAMGGDLSYGRFNDVLGNFYVSGPITDTLRGRIALNAEHADDWQKSSSRDDSLGKKRSVAGRALLDWNPAPGAHIELNLNGWIDKSDPQALQFIAFAPQAPAFAKPVLEQAAFSPLTPRAADWTPGLPFSDRKFGQAALRGDFDLTSSIKLTALASYDYLKQTQATDEDGLPYQAFDFPRNDGRARSFNEEVRIANASTSSFRWVIGENYESSNVKELQLGQFGDGSNSNPYDFDIYQAEDTIEQQLRNYAFFGNAEYDLLPSLTIKGGLRYSSTRDRAALCDLDAGDGRVNELFTAVANGEQAALQSGIVVPPILQGQCYSLNDAGLPTITPLIETLQQHNVSWRVGVDYKVQPDVLLYANISKGFKAGTFPTILASNTSEFQPVQQESVQAYEAGFKTSLADHVIQIDGAGFYYDYGNKQVHGRVNIPPFGPLDALINVPKSRIYGAELEGTLRPIAGLSIAGGVTYVNSKVIAYQGYDVLGNIENFAGDSLPTTPKFTYSLNVDYDFPALGDGGRPFVGATVLGRSQEDAVFGGSNIVLPGAPFRSEPGLTHPFLIDAYATIDLRAGFRARDDKWRVMIWAKNVFNKYYASNVVVGDDAVARFAGLPASYGITFGFKM